MLKKDSLQDFDLVIFGAKGDLANRKLFPALYRLDMLNFLSKKTRIIGVGRANWNINQFCEIIKKYLKINLGNIFDNLIWKRFSSRLDFCNIDVDYYDQFSELKKKINQNERITLYYFAMLPEKFSCICEGLGINNLNNYNCRIIVEKPLGTCLNSFITINKNMIKYFNENQIYRIDHYLGKETIINLLVLRFSNFLLLNNWDYKSIDHIQITISEKIGIENRGNYFDNIGQMRDMVQNHLLQILSIIAMSPPNSLNDDCIKNEKKKILKSLRPIDINNIDNIVVRGQYTSGVIKNKKVLGYLNEKNINSCSYTETFVSMRIYIDNWRWSGVPFYLRTGKRLPIKSSEIVVYFKQPQHNLFYKKYPNLSKNRLVIRLQPNEGISLDILSKLPSLNNDFSLKNINLDFDFSKNFFNNTTFDAYEKLLLEIMRGVKTLFVSYGEIEESWKWIDPIIKKWDTDNNTMKFYKAGTWGPNESFTLINRDKRTWYRS